MQSKKENDCMVNPWKALATVILLVTVCTKGFTYPLGKPGTALEYNLSSDIALRPADAVQNGMIVVKAEFSLGPVVDRHHQWFGISFTRQNGQTYKALVLIDKWPRGKLAPEVLRYLWCEPGWPDYIEYVNEVTGKSELPRFELWQFGWPQTADAKSPASFARVPKAVQLHGWPFKLDKIIKNTPSVPEKTTIVKLNPDVIIGLAGVHRDVDGRHKESLGRDYYNYIVPQSDDDRKKEIASGLNLFFTTAGEKQSPWIWRTNAYVSQMFVYPDDWPAHLYRSNYWGRSILVDEPAIYNRAFDYNTQNAGKLTPTEVSKNLEVLTMSALNKTDNNYGNRILGVWVDKVFGKGSLDIVERKFPAWEAIWQTSWYELAPEGTVCGVVDEDFYPEVMIESYNAALETQIPPTVESAAALRIAVGRGAARNFHKQWGTSIYAYGKGALNPKINLTALKCAYEAGATYFWHWYGLARSQ